MDHFKGKRGVSKCMANHPCHISGYLLLIQGNGDAGKASGGSWELGIKEAPDAYYASNSDTEGDDRR